MVPCQVPPPCTLETGVSTTENTGVSVESAAGVSVGDYQNELGMDGAPDPYVEIEQGGRTIYRSPALQGESRMDWGLKAVNLFVEPGENLVVRVWDSDASSDDLVLATNLPAQALRMGSFQTRTPAGSFVHLRFEPRRIDEPRAMAQVH